MLNRRIDLYSYDIFPKVVPVGRGVTITVQALDPHLMQDFSYTVSLYAINDAGKVLESNLPCTPLAAPRQGFTVTVTLPKEQEYLLQITYADKARPQANLQFYALEDDLLCRKPLFGEFHAHSFFSDGKQGPVFLAAEYRKQGFDFLSVTEHRRRMPSTLAVEAFEGLDLPFKLYPGEEVHPQDIRTHIVNFASDNSANAFALKEKDQATWRDRAGDPLWFEELERVKATLPELPENVSADEVASATIVSRIIREGGGMCILAHPHWRYPLHSVTDETTRYFLESGLFDALELIGGQHWSDNYSQIAYYNQLTAEGMRIPVVGASDEHGVLPVGVPPEKRHYFTEERTLVFAKENSREGIIEAVKGCYSAAMFKPVDQFPQINGCSYRLFKYAMFLLLNYFPLRDELCAVEGRLMHEYAAGTPGAKEKLLRTVEDNAYFEDKYFCR